ncbi:hypothetical protein [Pseudomonas muyukensis]|uniref:Uncharacterized protein n=1 Tax=Pseudomonas muyukensis TaxID=2842357 RepID=A0ABX8M617_9PSED|nr:hypothetical protein [Pseudomonas muyukensis]QXH33913.1 hypothetical protein KSS95_17270 [Pseudomonas muyukensis]
MHITVLIENNHLKAGRERHLKPRERVEAQQRSAAGIDPLVQGNFLVQQD